MHSHCLLPKNRCANSSSLLVDRETGLTTISGLFFSAYQRPVSSTESMKPLEQDRCGKKTVHLVLFDGNCPFCSRAVLFLLCHHLPEHFLFASQSGETAALLRASPLRRSVNNKTLSLILHWGDDAQQLLQGISALSTLLCAVPSTFLQSVGWTLWLMRPLSSLLYWIVARLRGLSSYCCPLPPRHTSHRFLP